MGVRREGARAISLGIRTDKNKANRAHFSSAPRGGSNKAEDYVAFECRQSPCIREAKTGLRPGVKSLSRAEIPGDLVSALAVALIP